MSQQQMIIGVVKQGAGMLGRHLADFTDADMLVRPTATANHAAWQLSHVLKSTAAMIGMLRPGVPAQLPVKIGSVTKELATSDDAADFATRDELLAAFERINADLVSAVEGMDEASLDQPAPEPVRGFAATMGALALMPSMHTTMHIGQLQVIRRALGKPVLF